MAEPHPGPLDPLEDCPWRPARALFRRLGYQPLPPAAVEDFQLPGRLWEFIYAMAGRQFFLHYTDHLSDRALYTWVHNQWLPEQVADAPPQAGWICNVCILELGCGNDRDEAKWLRLYAGEAEREAWALENGRAALPPHAAPPFDRDRWLPVPRGTPPDADADPGFPPDEDEEAEDPLGLRAVDAAIRAERRSAEQTEAIPEALIEDWQRPIDQLRRAGAAPIPPAELTAETVTAKLWELLHHLACRGFYVRHTDHLSDTELYAALWAEGLRDDALLPGRPSRTSAWVHDFIGSGSEADTALWLRYYATNEEHAAHVQDWPDDPLPPREPPPFCRDWRLPQTPF
jgi:hypothetical protein